jgi:hypothetical protein
MDGGYFASREKTTGRLNEKKAASLRPLLEKGVRLDQSENHQIGRKVQKSFTKGNKKQIQRQMTMERRERRRSNSS